MRDLLTTLKPAASARTQLLTASMLWTGVGIGLTTAGALWFFRATTGHQRWWVLVAAAIGLAKGHFAIAPVIRRAIERIRTRGDGRCLGGLLSVRTWLFVLTMIVGGRLLRATAIPQALLGCIYVAVGLAILYACRRAWRAWMGLA